MKIIEFNKKQQTLRVRVDTLDDIWYLDNVIEIGDTCYGIVYRREPEKKDMLRSKAKDRIKMRVGLRVESTEFQEFSDRYRIHGKIVSGPEDYIGVYHTLIVKIGDTLEIQKLQWLDVQIQELKKAETNTKNPLLLIVAIERREATIAILHEYGVQELSRMSLDPIGKDYSETVSRDNKFGDILHSIDQYLKPDMPLIIVGPGFIKEQFYAYLQSKGYYGQVIVANTSYGGIRGIYEALKSGALTTTLSKYRIKQESDLIEFLLAEIHREGLYAYGFQDTKKYAELGAIKILLITDTAMKLQEVKELTDLVKNSNGTVKVISTHHEPGKMLKSLGNVAAILRFR